MASLSKLGGETRVVKPDYPWQVEMRSREGLCDGFGWCASRGVLATQK
jgi:hypothetical protein